MKNTFRRGAYRFELVVEREGQQETITLYRIIESRGEANGYSKALIDMCDIQNIKWQRVEWFFDECN